MDLIWILIHAWNQPLKFLNQGTWLYPLFVNTHNYKHYNMELNDRRIGTCLKNPEVSVERPSVCNVTEILVFVMLQNQ